MTAWRIRMDAWNSKLSNDHYLVQAEEYLWANVDQARRASEPAYAYIEELFEPDRTWNEISHSTAVIGLLGRDNDTKIQVIDALIEAAHEGRADPTKLGEIAAQILHCDIGNLKRYSDSMSELSRISPLLSWFCLIAVERIIGGFDKLPRGAANLLEFYLNGLIELELAAPCEVIEACKTIKGSSKSAKAAKRIIQCEGNEHSRIRNEAKLIAVQSRIDRAKRWQHALTQQ